jgi:hypothetical protein
VNVAITGNPLEVADRDLDHTHAQEGTRWWGPIALAVGVLGTLSWIVAAMLMSGRGFDVTDEGFYLLSYRWWDSNLRNFTGVQVIYGPIFELLEYDIQRLRIVRLMSVVAAHAALGMSLARWLAVERRGGLQRLERFAIMALVLASGGVMYGWLPLSPGYNDVSILGSLSLCAVMLSADSRAKAGLAVPAWLPAVAGAVVVGMVFAKWTSAAIVVIVLGLPTFVSLRRTGGSAARRFVVWAVAGMFGAAAIVHLLLTPLNDLARGMAEVNRLVAATSNSPVELILMYLRSTGSLFVWALILVGLPLLLVVAARLSPTRWAGGLAALSTFSLLCLVALFAFTGVATGGADNVFAFASLLTGLALVVSTMAPKPSNVDRADQQAAPDRREGQPHGHALILWALICVPAAQALGTGNPLYIMAINAYAAWLVAMIIVVLRFPPGRRTPPIRLPALAATAVAALVAASVGATGALLNPYRTVDYATATYAMTRVPALSSLRLDPAVGSDLERLNLSLNDLGMDDRPMLAFDEMTGVVLAVGGRPVGEPWLSRLDRARSAAGIRATCPAGREWQPLQFPVIITDRPLSTVETGALRECGVDFEKHYRPVAIALKTLDVDIFRPTQNGK